MWWQIGLGPLCRYSSHTTVPITVVIIVNVIHICISNSRAMFPHTWNNSKTLLLEGVNKLFSKSSAYNFFVEISISVIVRALSVSSFKYLQLNNSRWVLITSSTYYYKPCILSLFIRFLYFHSTSGCIGADAAYYVCM